MKVSKRVTRRHRSLSEKVAHIAKRIYRLGFENMKVQTVPCGFSCKLDYPEAQRVFKQMHDIDHLRGVLTKRLCGLVRQIES